MLNLTITHHNNFRFPISLFSTFQVSMCVRQYVYDEHTPYLKWMQCQHVRCDCVLAFCLRLPIVTCKGHNNDLREYSQCELSTDICERTFCHILCKSVVFFGELISSGSSFVIFYFLFSHSHPLGTSVNSQQSCTSPKWVQDQRFPCLSDILLLQCVSEDCWKKYQQ